MAAKKRTFLAFERVLNPQEGDDVYDIRTRSTLAGLNGMALNRW